MVSPADYPGKKLYLKARSFGYDGLELACWGDHFDPAKAARDRAYCEGRREILRRDQLGCFAISNHLVGQAVCDVIDARHKSILPPRVWGDGKRDGVRKRAWIPSRCDLLARPVEHRVRDERGGGVASDLLG